MSRFDDIISLEHPTSKKHPRMSLSNRGAQFAPFAALTGFDNVIDETGRETKELIELDEYQKDEINDILLYVKENKNVAVKLSFFVKDKLKEGGEYLAISTRVRKIDEDNRQLVLCDGNTIDIDNVVSISLLE